MTEAVRRIGPFTWIGMILVFCAALPVAELVAEQTIFTWLYGIRMVGFALAHSILGPLSALSIFLAGAWVAVFLAIAAIRKSIGNRFNLVLVGFFALCVGALFIPYGSWMFGMVFLAGQHAPADWLTYAAATGDESLINYMLAHGYDVNATDRNGRSALGAAAVENKTEIALMLLSKGARIDSRTYTFGSTPLLDAAQMDHLDMVKLLIEHGADPNERETGGCKCTALDWAIKHDNQEMAAFLRSHMK